MYITDDSLNFTSRIYTLNKNYHLKRNLVMRVSDQKYQTYITNPPKRNFITSPLKNQKNPPPKKTSPDDNIHIYTYTHTNSQNKS